MNRLASTYFERIYDGDPDPWGFESRWYERRKYALTLAALPRARYASAFEPGCSHGVLTELLAPRCDRLIAAELVPEVAARARDRLRTAGHRHVQVLDLAIPDDWPGGTFDLAVLSEVLYYLTADGLAETLARLDACLVSAAHVVAVHWRGETDYPLTGDEVHAALDRHPGWRPVASHREDELALDVYEVRR